MNNMQLEKLLLGARPHYEEWSPLTQSVIRQIKQRAALTNQLHPTNKEPRKSMFIKLRALHGTGLAVAAIATIMLVSGVAYAAAQFLPDLIRVINKGVNSIGRIEYTAPAFGDCYGPGDLKTDVFEVLPTAKISDEDVEKTLRAKCELMGIDKFTSDKWPTYGQHKKWKEGDTIYYTRPDILGTVVSVNKHKLVIRLTEGLESTKTYTTFEGHALQAFSRGQRIDVSTIKPGDFVFSLVRVSETYRAPQTLYKADNVSYVSQPNNSPKPRGLVAVVKMSLPERYYTSMQQYIYEVKPCFGNPDERCTNGPIGPSIDVFPREGGEGASNPYVRTDTTGLVGREVNGILTAITVDSLTIKASSGALYTVRIPKSWIDAYNTTYAPAYDSFSPHPTAVRVHVGSWIGVLYRQKSEEDRAHIALPDIIKITLLTDIAVKKGPR